MRLNLTGRHLDITPALRRLVTTRVGKLERVLNDSAVSAQVVLAREKHRHLTEITLHARGEQFLHAVGDTGDWKTSLADATDKLAHQAQRLKGKRQERKRHGVKGTALALFEQRVAADVSPAPARVRPRMPRTLRASRQAIRVMSVADAARGLDGSRDGIVVFLDPGSALINVMYRRQDGELTLVEIEL
ncbi:MAG: ribosome-associated translation inhibitor RaiA [Vicinamibacterales bacterium]|nr:ribosome-associated translation inhibitor RaiA [Vicinamibacterales bacterium]